MFPPIAKEYRSQFEEILVDEYQDTNQVQKQSYLKLNVVTNLMGIYSW